jgi:hypothetical protein
MLRPVPPPCCLLPRWTTRLRGFVGVALLGLPSCTPVTHAGSTFDWVVTNQTTDTLRVGVRYPLDSSQVLPTDLPHLRRQWFADSAVEHGVGYRRNPLTRLVQHAGHWYYVQPQAWPSPLNDDAHGPRRWAQGNRLAGTLTYAVPPHGRQLVTQTICLPCDTIPLPRLLRATRWYPVAPCGSSSTPCPPVRSTTTRRERFMSSAWDPGLSCWSRTATEPSRETLVLLSKQPR